MYYCFSSMWFQYACGDTYSSMEHSACVCVLEYLLFHIHFNYYALYSL